MTNGSHRQLHKIEALGLETRASCTFVSEVFGCRKPEATIFLAAAACLNARPAEILFVGDDPEADIWGAHCAGMKTAWLHRGRAWPPALSDQCIDLSISSVGELADIVAVTLFRTPQ